MVGTLITMGTISVVSLVVERVCNETGHQTHAQYASMTASTALAVTAIKSAIELFNYLKGIN